MSTILPSLILLGLATVVASAVPSEAPAALPQDVRASVESSLPFIEKIGTDWMEKRSCNSCHVVTFLVWSHHAAAAHGLNVDGKKLAEWKQWALADAHSDRYWFKLRPHAMEALAADGVGAAILAKLKPLVGKTHTTEKLFLEALEKALGPEDFACGKEQLIKRATLPNNGGGADTLAQLLLGRKTAGEDKATADSYASVRALLLEWQNPNGSWAADGQLPGLKWDGENEANDATTMWSLLAASAGDPTDEAIVRSRQRAQEYLKTAGPGKTVQTLALRMIVAHQFGETARAETLRAELLSRQNADGGWSWWKENKTSDAFATGQALYALGRVGRDGSDPAVGKAWRFLIQTQGEDGGWLVPMDAINKRTLKLNVYLFWGTAWAAIGLLETLPAPDGVR